MHLNPVLVQNLSGVTTILKSAVGSVSARSTRTSSPSFVSVLIYLLYSQALKTSEASFVLADRLWFDYPGGSLL